MKQSHYAVIACKSESILVPVMLDVESSKPATNDLARIVVSVVFPMQHVDSIEHRSVCSLRDSTD